MIGGRVVIGFERLESPLSIPLQRNWQRREPVAATEREGPQRRFNATPQRMCGEEDETYE